MNGKKIVFFDIDGTIWDWEGKIPLSCIDAIRKLRANGHYAFICSGRAKGHICSKELLDIGFDGIVAACGAYVEIDNKVIYNYLIPDDIVKFTVETLLKANMPTVLEGPVKHWITEFGFVKDAFVDNMIKAMGSNAVMLKTYVEGMEINKFASDILRCTDYDYVKKTLSPYFDFIEHGLTPDLNDEPGEEDNAIIGVVESVPHNMTKASGVKMVCDYLNIDMENVYAIGDSANDIDMLKAAKHSICMGNGALVAKENAEYVTSDIMDDGIFNALKHYSLI